MVLIHTKCVTSVAVAMVTSQLFCEDHATLYSVPKFQPIALSPGSLIYYVVENIGEPGDEISFDYLQCCVTGLDSFFKFSQLVMTLQKLMMHVHLLSKYRVVGNFRRRTFLQIGGKIAFHRKTCAEC